MNYLHSIRVQWARKSCVDGRFPFDVEKPEKWETKYTRTLKEIPVISVSRQQFDKIGNTLNDLPIKVLSAMENFKIVVKYKDKYLAIDTSGYKYPRYKSHVVIQENH